MRAAVRMLWMLALLPLAACPEDKPIDFSAAKKPARSMPAPRVAAKRPRETMPDFQLPFELPSMREAPTIAVAKELVLFDGKTLLRRATSSGFSLDGAAPYTRPVLPVEIAATGRLDDSAGDVAFYVDTHTSVVDTFTLIHELGVSTVALAVNARGRRGQLPYLFGGVDATARDRVQIDLSDDELVLGDQTLAGPAGTIEQALASALAARREQTTLGIEARIAVRSGMSLARLFSILDVLAAAKVESVVIVRSTEEPHVASYRGGGGIPTVRIGQPNAQGDLDKAIIRRYIKRNVQKITYCYEKELLASPDLSGTVSVQFFIAPTGQVATAAASGVSPRVASCVQNVIKSIEFPKPKGGVQVNYPFTMRPDGG